MFGRSIGVLVVFAVLGLSAMSLGATYGGGSGTAEDPYQIWTPEQMNTIGANSADWDKHFKLMDNIDMSAYTGTQYNIIGNAATQFSGIFEGVGHLIHNLTINSPNSNYIGLFGCIGTTGIVKNLGLRNTNIIASNYVGNLAGQNNGLITHCYAESKIQARDRVGGLVGYNKGVIIYCYAKGQVTADSYTGGLVGEDDSASLKYCYSITKVISSESSMGIGGAVGHSFGGGYYCFWDIETSGCTTSAGSVIGMGKTTSQMKDIQTYIDMGWWFVSETNKSGDWIMPENEYPKLSWEVYPLVTIPDTKGLTETEARSILLSAGLLPDKCFYVFDPMASHGCVSDTYPKSGNIIHAGLTPVHLLIAKESKYSGGDGITMPFKIKTIDDLIDMTLQRTDWGRSFILTADINLEGIYFEKSLISPAADQVGYPEIEFGGIFEGNGHVIKNLIINGSYRNYSGFIGKISSAGRVSNLGIENITMYGNAYIGGLAGVNMGAITSCYTQGSLKSLSIAGGVAGINSGVIQNSYSKTDVSSIQAGGLVGLNWGRITSCYATGFIFKGGYLGGLIGRNESDYVTGCFWDLQTSGRKTGVGGGSTTGIIGKTTIQMQTRSTFESAGWDFVDTWAICEGMNYPRLLNMIPSADMVCPDGVGAEDLDHFASQWLMPECGILNDFCQGADIDQSSVVDLGDFVFIAEQWLLSDSILPPSSLLPSPVALWKMDEATGMVAADSAGGHDGQVVNAAGTLWVAGWSNNALKLDGVDDYVDVAGYAGITGTASRTCTAWIKATANGKEQVILSWGNAVNGQKWMFRVQSDGKLAAAVWGGYIQSGVSVADGQWHHVAAVLFDDGSPSVNEIKLYVDGFPQTVTSSSSQAINTVASQNVQMGSVYSGTAQTSFFSGLLDEVRIYDVPLTGNQILRVAME